MQLCDLMENNVNSCSDKAHKGYRPVGYWAKHSDIDWSTVIYDENLVEFQLKESALFKEIYDNSVMPFDGSYPYFTQTSTHGYTLSNDRVKFPLKRFDPANAELIGALAKGTRIVIILEQYINGSARFCVFGLSGGLRLSEETALDMSGDDKTIEVDLVDVNTNYPNLFFWAGSEAATLSLLEYMVNYESITGLSLADGSVTPQVVYLKVDSDKACRVVLPDNTVLTSTAGVIDTTWTGAAGDVILLVDKNSSYLGLSKTLEIGSDYYGNLVFWNAVQIDMNACKNIISVTSYNAIGLVGNICESVESVDIPNSPVYIEMSSCNSMTSANLPFAIGVDMSDNQSLTEISAPNATYIFCNHSLNISNINAPNATEIYAQDCALTSVAIASLLAELVATGKEDGTLDVSVGTNADYATWSLQAKADAATLQTRGWTITYNEA